MFSRRNAAFLFITHFACFSLCFVLLDCQVCLVKQFVFLLFLRLCRNVVSDFCRQTVLFYFCCVRHLMWAEGVSMSFCGGYGIGFYGFCFATDVETSFARRNNRAHRTVCVICVRLRCFYLCLCYLSLRARTQSMQNCANRLTICAAKPTVELFVATIFQFSARLSVKDLLFCAAGSDDSV